MVIIAGDFNFGDQNVESSVEFKDCKDAWIEEYKRKNNITGDLPSAEVVKSGQVPKQLSPIGGFTFDITRNPLANLSCEHHRYPRRLDRIMYRAFNPVHDSVQVFAVDPYPIAAASKEQLSACRTALPTDGNIYPSDHFGLCAEFMKDDTMFAGSGAAAIGRGHATAENVSSIVGNNNNDDDQQQQDDGRTSDRQSGQPVPFNASKIDPVVAAMSRAGGFGKNYRSALVFLPPPALYDRINRFRQNGRDKAYPRWPSHATILFPFVSSGKFGDAISLIEAAMKTKLINVEPFRVKLRKIGTFPRGQKSVVYFDPECVSRKDSNEKLGIAPMKAIFEPLQYLFPQCGRGGGNDDDNVSGQQKDESTAGGNNSQSALADAYHPHFTLGMTHNPKDHQAFLAEIDNEWEPVEFDISQFHLIAHLDGKDGYEVIHSFDLESGASAAKKDHNDGLRSLVAGNNGNNNNNNSAAAAAATAPSGGEGKVMATILEPPQWGSRFLKPYLPPDPLEQWMASVSIQKYARDAPTHISQLGGMYHIPGDLLDDFLKKWRESYLLRNNTAGYMEEVRGNPFRLYLDLDFDLSTSETPVDKSYALDLCREICILTNKIFNNSDPTVAVFECHGSASKKFADGSVPDPDDVEQQKNIDAADVRAGKSGYRLYFQRVFVDQVTYDKYLDAVANYLRRKHWPLPENIVRGVTWDDVVDKKAAEWDRGRLLGTIKRRKNLKRIYEFEGIVTVRGTHEVLTRDYASSILRQLYGSTLRLWEVLPQPEADGKPVLMDNEFTLQRLFSWDANCEAAAATAHI